MEPNHIYLTGVMGSGKTTVGRHLAQLMGLDFIDTDQQIEDFFTLPVAEIFRIHGEPAFRSEEARIVSEIASETASSLRKVVALGGGTLLNPESRKQLLNSGAVIWLTADEEELWSRLSPSLLSRPLLNGNSPDSARQKLKELMIQREPFYREAHFEFNTVGMTPHEVARALFKISASKIWA